MKDYNTNNNPNLYRGSNKNSFMSKSNKIKRILTKKKGDKNPHFMSYDMRSSLNKYDIINHPCLTETSMDSSMRKAKKRMKNKRNSSITKFHNPGNLSFLDAITNLI